MAANQEFYPYTDDPNAGYQLCTKTLAQLTDQIGNELEPSIFLGGSSPLRTMFVGMAWERADANTLTYAHTETNTFPAKRFGLCDARSNMGTSEYHYNYDNYNPVYPGTTSALAHGSCRKNYNNTRWTAKEKLPSGWYDFCPVVKLLKGCCVGYLSIKAAKPLPLEFATLADYNSWKNNIFSGTYDGYQAVKETYPNIIEISVTFKAGTVIGGTNRTKTLYLFFDTGNAPMNDGSSGGAYDGSFSYYQPTGMYNEGTYDGGDGTPKGAKHVSYPAVSLVFKGGWSSTAISPKMGAAWENLRYYSSWYILFGVGSIRVAQSSYTNDGVTYPVTCLFFEGDIDEIFKAFTDLGFAMTTQGSNKAQSGDIPTDPTIYVPTYDQNGNIDGNSNTSKDGQDYVDSGASGAPINPNFDPYSGGDDDDEDPIPEEDPSEEQKTTDIPLPNVTLTSYGVFNKSYVCSKMNLQALSDYLWNGDPTTWDTIIEDLKLVGDNRMNSIINVIMFPFAIPNDGEPHLIRIGRHNTDVSAAYLDGTQNIVFNMGTCYVMPKHGNFLDYEPHTKLWLYIPFIGVFSVPTQQFMNKLISIKLAVDVLTGAGMAVVYAAGIPVLYKNCKIGMQIPVTGADSGYIIRNYIETIKSGITTAGNIASGNIGGTVSGLFNMATSALAAQGAPIQSEGSASPQCGMLMPNKCYFIIEYPRTKISDVPDYGHMIGYACRKSGQIGTFAGFSRFENVTLDISHCTQTERDEILMLLRNGVYL